MSYLTSSALKAWRRSLDRDLNTGRGITAVLGVKDNTEKTVISGQLRSLEAIGKAHQVVSILYKELQDLTQGQILTPKNPLSLADGFRLTDFNANKQNFQITVSPQTTEVIQKINFFLGKDFLELSVITQDHLGNVAIETEGGFLDTQPRPISNWIFEQVHLTRETVWRLGVLKPEARLSFSGNIKVRNLEKINQIDTIADYRTPDGKRSLALQNIIALLQLGSQAAAGVATNSPSVRMDDMRMSLNDFGTKNKRRKSIINLRANGHIKVIKNTQQKILVGPKFGLENTIKFKIPTNPDLLSLLDLTAEENGSFQISQRRFFSSPQEREPIYDWGFSPFVTRLVDKICGDSPNVSAPYAPSHKIATAPDNLPLSD